MAPDTIKEYRTYVRVQPAFTDMIAKIKEWIDPTNGLVVITSYEHTATAATLRAMRLFEKLGCGPLVMAHRTAPVATADVDIIVSHLTR